MSSIGDEALARAAVDGDCGAFAELYDRHEHRAFNLAYRICGTREDAADATQDAFVKVLARLPAMAGRDLDFGSYLLTAVRHASYDVIAAARRAEPVEELPAAARPVGAGHPPPEDDPDRGVLLAAQQEEIRAANATLPPRQREVLALRELEGLSYDEIAGLMGMNRNSVAQLISRARIGLRDALRRTALQSIVPASPACEHALARLAMRDDGEREVDLWLDEHLAACETCVLGREAMAEAGASYRAWATVPALEALRREAIAHAGDCLGRRWSAPAARSPRRLLRRRLRREALAGAAAGVVLLLAVMAPQTRDGSLEAQEAPPQAAAAAANPAGAARATRPPAIARRVTTAAPIATAPERATVPAAAAAPAAPAAGAAPAPAPEPASRPARAVAVPRATSVPAAPPAPAQAADPTSVEHPAPPEDGPADTAPPLPPDQPPAPRPVVTNLAAAPPPPSSVPRRTAPRRPAGGSSGVPVP